MTRSWYNLQRARTTFGFALRVQLQDHRFSEPIHFADVHECDNHVLVSVGVSNILPISQNATGNSGYFVKGTADDLMQIGFPTKAAENARCAPGYVPLTGKVGG